MKDKVTALSFKSGFKRWSYKRRKILEDTPMFNWYMSNNLRFELAYGYGILNRYDLKGATDFFQTRLQFMF